PATGVSSMTDTALAGDAETPSSAVPPRGRRHLFGGRTLRMFGFVVVLASVLVSFASFMLMSGTTSYEPTPEQWTIIWVVNGVLVLTVLALVVTEAVMLIQARWTRQAGSGLQLRMVAMFAFAA